MLGSLRTFTSSIYAKILMGIIIIPFVFWGMGSSFRGGDKNIIVVIEKEKYSVQAFVDFIKKFAKTTQMGAYGSSIHVGKNDKIACDKAAVEMMRKELNQINMKGKIVIGEGELDNAPMLYIGENVGNNNGEEFDIAVDPLEGTNFAAKNLPNALSVLAVARKGNLFSIG